MSLFTLGLYVLTVIAFVHGQSQFHLTPNIAAVEQVIDGGQSLFSLDDLRSAIGLSSSFSLSVEYTSEASNGLRRQKLRILFQGIPIRIVRLQASIDDHGFYTGSVSGYYPTNIPANFDTSGQRTITELTTAMRDYINANDQDLTVLPITNAMIKEVQAEKQIDLDSNGNPSLVYYMRGLIDEPTANGVYIRFPRGLIKVSNLQPVNIELLVLKESQTKRTCPKAMGGNEKYPGYVYGPGPHRKCLRAKKVGKTCFYQNNKVIVMTVGNSYDRSTSQPMSFKCSKGPNDEINDSYSPSSDAFYFAKVFFRMLKKWTGLNNIHDGPLKMHVHFGEQYPNSFYDGKDVTIGDGTSLTYSVAIQEAIGHELCHSLTDRFGSVQLSTESLALNEAFSDICGKAVTVFDSDGVNDWTFAKRFIRNKMALRYFYNPPLDGFTIGHMDDFNLSNGPYSLMGVFTKFMYSVVAQQNVRFRDAFQAFVFANRMYWNEQSSMIDGACGVLRAASDLALDTDAFVAAFNGVGIQLGFCDLSGTQDVIVYQSGYGHVLRTPIVSISKNPIYIIKPASGANYVYISATNTENDADICIFYQGNSYSIDYGNSVSLPLGSSDITIGLKSDKAKDTRVSLDINFY